MSFDKPLLESLIKENDAGSCKFQLHLNDKEYSLLQVSILNSPNPVNSPTTRGGVYFADKFAYKIKGTIEDLSIVPLLSKTMLGPNTEFGEIKITTEMNMENQKRDVIIHTNLTNSVQGPSKIELNMIIVKIQLG
ncbi:MAG: hypothetical protein GTN97_01920 [Nitrosopumilaceae archaeon]|nr:hypothetical protein [Nitrosopumilaceae archaeon]NIP09908.1 hypothetical protein [Nitrosopumilaceae archaeon]NIS94679.1 hypothetical protein [Nitrosopumilaceae archaeon]